MAYVRQRMPRGSDPYPVPSEMIDEFWSVYRKRLDGLPKPQHDEARRIFEIRKHEWVSRQPPVWESRGNEGNYGLAFRAGEDVPDHIVRNSWPVLQSMRNVDAECQIKIPTATDILSAEI